MSSDRRTRTAYHEAGHAIAALVSGVRFRLVTIRPAAESLGRVLLTRQTHRMAKRLELEVTPYLVGRAHNLCVIDLAGGLAVKRLTGRRGRGCWGDDENAVDLASLVCGSLPATEAFLRWCYVSAEDTVAVHWRMIEAVADTLVAQEVLTEDEVRAAFARAVEKAISIRGLAPPA